MIRKYSNRTLDELAHFLDQRFTHTEMTSLFFGLSVPKEYDQGINKLERALSVITKIAEAPEPKLRDILDELLKEVISRRAKFFEPGWDSGSPHESTRPLLNALRLDGYEVKDGVLLPLDSLEQELTEEISILYGRLQLFGMQDVQSHLDQAHQNFIEERFEACNAMLRTAFESTLQNVVKHLSGGLENIPRTNREFLTPSDVRKYLVNRGFFVDDEAKYIKEFYGYASTNGSHPGLSNEVESRLRRLMIVALIQYCLEKLLSRR